MAPVPSHCVPICEAPSAAQCHTPAQQGWNEGGWVRSCAQAVAVADFSVCTVRVCMCGGGCEGVHVRAQPIMTVCRDPVGESIGLDRLK